MSLTAKCAERKQARKDQRAGRIKIAKLEAKISRMTMPAEKLNLEYKVLYDLERKKYQSVLRKLKILEKNVQKLKDKGLSDDDMEELNFKRSQVIRLNKLLELKKAT